MIDSKYQKIVFSFFMSFLMSGIISMVISIANMGFVSNIINIWLSSWAFAFSIAFPAIIIVSPFVHKLVSLVVKDDCVTSNKQSISTE